MEQQGTGVRPEAPLSVNAAEGSGRPSEALSYEGPLEDITERKQALEALLASQERYRDLFENAHDIIYTTSLQGEFTSFNQAGERVTGYTREEALGKSFRDVVAPEHQELVQEMIRRKLGGEAHTTYELEIVAKDGTRRFLETSSRLMFSEGCPVGVQAIARDITERKRAEAVVAKQALELARSNAELEHFAWIVSHDLQEPLRIARSFAELLAERCRGRLDADADEFISHIVDATQRMHKLIQALLEYSRVSTRDHPFSHTDGGEVLERVLRDLSVPLRETGATVTQDPLPVVMADGLQLGQLFQNLIGNAVKFRRQEPPRIHVAADRQAAEWVFSVRDNGIGIDPAEFERIFQIFERGHAQQTYPGTGIGLAISKRIVERHGGRIWLESKPGEGSTFYFTIPAE